MQGCPAVKNLRQAMRLAARSTLALRSTMAGLLPPSSKVTGTNRGAAMANTLRPTAGLPVKKMWSKRKASIIGGSTSAPGPCTTNTCYVRKASAMIFSSTAAVCGVSSLGCTTAQLPAAIAPTNGESTSRAG